jgi:hypothetical protein
MDEDGGALDLQAVMEVELEKQLKQKGACPGLGDSIHAPKNQPYARGFTPTKHILAESQGFKTPANTKSSLEARNDTFARMSFAVAGISVVSTPSPSAYTPTKNSASDAALETITSSGENDGSSTPQTTPPLAPHMRRKPMAVTVSKHGGIDENVSFITEALTPVGFRPNMPEPIPSASNETNQDLGHAVKQGSVNTERRLDATLPPHLRLTPSLADGNTEAFAVDKATATCTKGNNLSSANAKSDCGMSGKTNAEDLVFFEKWPTSEKRETAGMRRNRINCSRF